MSDLLTGKDAPNFRIVSGTPAAVEHAFNQLLEEYVATHINFSVVKDEVIVTALLIHTRVVNRQQLAAARMPGIRQ